MNHGNSSFVFCHKNSHPRKRKIGKMKGRPVRVHDAFHMSTFYWRETSEDASSDSETEEVNRPKPVTKDTIKLKFYANILNDSTESIHFGRWTGIDMDHPDAYAQASANMTDYMFDLAKGLLPHRLEANDFVYVDLGAGTGAAALHLCEKNPFIRKATCLNLCHEQNEMALQRAEECGFQERTSVVDGTFEEAPFADNTFDLAFSQDAFVHASNKVKTYAEAYRITKPGGALVLCDLMSGTDVSEEELFTFSKMNGINDWLTPAENVKACEEVGWRDVHWIDLTTDIRISFQRMLKKITFVLEHGDPGTAKTRAQLMNYRDRICNRITQIDRGMFKWAVIYARKPVFMSLACRPPVPFVNTNNLISEADEQYQQNVVVVDILTHMPKEKIEALPSTVELLITMSAGMDHIDLETCAANGIQVRQSGRDAITSHVVQYTLGFLILGLRDALRQISVPFPAKGWNLNWNCEGKPLTDCTIAIVGMGVIAKTLLTELRMIAPHTRILYSVPASMRDVEAEEKFSLEFCASLQEMAGACDVFLPLCPLNKHTEGIVSREVLNALKPHAGFINVARGKIVDHEALTEILQEKKIKYALLDTTFPEPLPEAHPLWKLDNCFIFPHYATNTMAVRESLVNEIQPIIEDHFGLTQLNEKRKQEEQALRYDLAVAHRLTAKYGMDMLVWNHISARFRTGCLITPGRKLWNQVKPCDLVFNSTNVTADVIHDAIYKARPDVKAVIHLHTPAATAVSCLEGGFVPFTQDAAYFYGKVANYEWDGLSNDSSEGPAITEAVVANPGCNTLLMHNHGFVCFGSSVREAWVLAYYFERCCEVQMNLMKCGGKVRMPPVAVMEEAAKASYLPEFAPGVCEWDSLCEEISFES